MEEKKDTLEEKKDNTEGKKEKTEERKPKLEEKQEDQERRNARRKRRIRNQILAYMTVLIFVSLVAGGVLFGMKWFTREQQTTQESSSEYGIEESSLPELPTEESSESFEEPIESIPEGPTAEERLEALIDSVIDNMTLEDKVAGLFLVTPESITGVSTAVKAGDGTKKALEQYAVGGLIYFKKNIKSEKQFKEMVENTKNMSRYEMFYAIDEEGGKVARLAEAGVGTKVDAAAKLGETGNLDEVYNAGVVLGSNLNNFGLNLDLAPVADLSLVNKSYIGDRSFGSDAITVGEMASAMMHGIQSQGVVSCVKHFPGIGSVTKDPHKGLVSTSRTEEEFRSTEFVAFQAAIDGGANMIMISNIAAPELTGNDEPCVFSEKLVTDILRTEMGFEGVVVTDAMDMSVVSNFYGADEAAVLALRAGCDMILMPEDFEKAYNGVLDAVKANQISEERVNDALRRIYRVKFEGRENETEAKE